MLRPSRAASLLGASTLSLVLASGALPAQQADVFGDEITVTATGVAETVDEVPVAVTVIDRDEIDDAQADTVAALLTRVPGVTVMQSGSPGGVTSLFLRGTESDHTLVLFDGVRLNSPFFSGYDWSQMSMAGVEQVEIARGPYSALWGSDAVGGVVNLIPRRAAPGSHGTLFGEGGEDGWRRYEGSYSYAGNGVDLVATALDRAGEDELPNSDFALTDLLVDLGWSWSPGNRVAILVQDLDGESGVPFDGALLTPNRRTTSEQRLIALPLAFRVSDGWSLDLNLASVERELGYVDPDVPPGGLTASETMSDSWSSRLASHHSLGHHTLSWGGEWREDSVDDASSYGVNLAGEASETVSAFVQDLWRLSDRVRLIAGARWDDTDAWGSEVSPRVNLGWQLNLSTELRLGYGEAFRQPSVGELYYPGSGNPELEAETSRTSEIGLAYHRPNTRTRLEASLFSTDLDNLVDFDYETFTFVNVASAEILGAELAHFVVYEDFTSKLALTWLDTEDAGGQPLLRRPEWTATYTLTGVLWKGVRGDLTMLYVGDRDDIDPFDYVSRVEADSFYTVDLAVAWQVAATTELTFRGLNLLDHEYAAVLGYPAPGRRLIGGLRFRL